MKVEITHRWSGAVLLSVEAGSLPLALEAGVRGADLWSANLRGADLRGANLRDAKNADSVRLDTGETLREYIDTVLPALLTAGGKRVEDVAAAWECHTWENCPMAVAFGVTSEEQVPALYRPRARQFVQLFDANLLPKPA